MLKFLFYYLLTNPLISNKSEFWFVNDFSVPVYRPTNIKSFFKTRDYFNSLEKHNIPQHIVKEFNDKVKEHKKCWSLLSSRGCKIHNYKFQEDIYSVYVLTRKYC